MTEQKAIVTRILPVGGDNGVVFLEAQKEDFQEIYELHSSPWLSTPNPTPDLPQKPKSGQIQEITPQPYLPPREGLQQMFY